MFNKRRSSSYYLYLIATVPILIIYNILAAGRVPDSDYQAYLQLYNDVEWGASCYLDPGFCAILKSLKLLNLSGPSAFFIIYIFLSFILVTYVISGQKKSFHYLVAFFVLLFFHVFLVDYYSAYHLFRQHIAIMLFIIMSRVFSIKFSFIASALIHSSVLVLMPIYFVFYKLKVQPQRDLYLYLTLPISFLIATYSYELIAFVVAIPIVPDSIIFKLSLYQDYISSSSINTAPLMIMTVFVILIVLSSKKSLSECNIKIFYTLLAALNLSLLFKDIDIISYRFLIFAKFLFIPLIIDHVPSISRFLIADRQP